ncbi:MAG: biotin/lipoyl-containing protein [Hyphomicrobiales bacterium]
MGEFTIKMPDVGEGVAEAELVEWMIKIGDHVREDMMVAAVMTDKATVEIPTPVSGTVVWLGGDVGDTIAVKAPLIRIATDGAGEEPAALETSDVPTPPPQEVATAEPPRMPPKSVQPAVPTTPTARQLSPEFDKPLAAPSVRLLARENGIDLRLLRGTGPAGRILREDVEHYLARGADPAPAVSGLAKKTSREEIKLTGLRRRIAEKMVVSTSRIPHIT